MQIVDSSTHPHLVATRRKQSVSQWKLWLLTVVTALIFCQAYFPVGGLTIRTEDVLVTLFLITFAISAIVRLKLRKSQDSISASVLIWMAILMVGVLVTLSQPLSSETQKDAILNGYRMILMSSLFFVAFSATSSAQLTLKPILKTVVIFSFVTTIVSILQIGHWDGWLPIRLPALLTEHGERVSSAAGREIFALFVSNNNAHGWSAMLAMQIFTVLFMGQTTKNPLKRTLMFVYVGLLLFILLRLSVRNSILGLAVAMMGYILLRVRHDRYLVNRLIKFLIFALSIFVATVLVLYILPESHTISRIRQVIPQFDDGHIIFARGSNMYGRFQYWQVAWEIFKHYPLVGGGFESYAERSTFWLDIPVVHAHNSYLHTLAELGVMGMFGLSLLGWQHVRVLGFLWQRALEDRYLVVGRNLLTCTLFFLIFTAIAGNPFFSTNQIGFFAILLGTLASYRRNFVTIQRPILAPVE